MTDRLKIIFIFVDGLGLNPDSKTNPLLDARLPNLSRLLSFARPIDACLGVDGLPQSATGQAALLTGINAPKTMGRHIEGFPPAALKELIQQENIFSKLQQIGKRCTFANSYWIDDPHQIPLRRQSVTTVMSLSALGGVRHKAELLDGKAVNHDITRWTMHTRGYTGELVTPETAADHLLSVAEENDCTLFEYFLTDRAGHSRDPDLISRILSDLERFIPRVAKFSEQPHRLFLLCSDHGNIEDPTTRTHTKNPVPLIALGEKAERFQTLTRLDEITPAIINCFSS